MQALWPDEGRSTSSPGAQGAIAVLWYTFSTTEAAAESALCDPSQHLAGQHVQLNVCVHYLV